MVDLKSNPIPPNSSGTELPMSPNSPASSINWGTSPSSCCSMRSRFGMMRCSTKSSVICFIISCSSVHSSGMKIASAVVSRIKNSPPRKAFD